MIMFSHTSIIHNAIFYSAGGPYLIGLNNSNVFLSVSEDDCIVGATTDIKNAATFFICQPVEDLSEPVIITHYRRKADDTAAKLRGQTMTRYLQVAVNGPNKGTLECRCDIKSRPYGRFMLHDRFNKKPVVDELESVLTNNKEGYYISCIGRKDSPESFLAVIRQPRGRDPPYSTACRSYKDSYDNDDMLMLFQFIRPATIETHSDQVKGIISQLKRYESFA